MCGRFVSSTPPDQLARYFGAEAPPPEQYLEENYNVAPTQAVYTVYEDGGVRRLDTFHWGLVPFWAKDPKVGNRMINARAETLADKNAYKRPFARRRCIVPADGFYEWTGRAGARQAVHIEVRGGALFGIAGPTVCGFRRLVRGGDICRHDLIIFAVSARPYPRSSRIAAHD